MWSVMCSCRHVRHMQARSCLSTGWNRCLAWLFGTVAVFVQGGGRGTVQGTVRCNVVCPAMGMPN